jgi:hypothetical protein
MGIYINPSNMSKEQWLSLHAKGGSSRAPASHYNEETNEVAVCLVDNGMFTAAAVAFEPRELEAFTYPDDRRPKKWFQVPVADVANVLDMPVEEWLTK